MTEERQISIPVWGAAIVATCLLLFLFQKVLWLVIPALSALVVYYCLRPVVRWLIRAGLKPRTAARAVAGILFSGTLLLVILVLPSASVRVANWQSLAERYVRGGLEFLKTTEQILVDKFVVLRPVAVLNTAQLDLETIEHLVAAKYLGSLFLQAMRWLPSILLMPYLTYFLLQDGNRFRKQLVRSVPNAYFEKTLLLFDRIDNSLQSFFVGLMKLTFLDTMCLGLGLWFFGVSSPLLLGLLAAVLAWVPYVGSVAGCIIVVLVTATDFPTQPGMTYGCVLLFFGVRILDDFVFLPHTIGRSLHIHPVLSVLMLFLGAEVAGPTGLVLVLPVLGVTTVVAETLAQIVADRTLYERFRHARRLAWVRNR